MKLSIVSSLYYSASTLVDFYNRIKAEAKKISPDSYEIILVNDGSPDNSLSMAIDLANIDPNLIIINLSRNFGHHKALMTGLKYATGEKIFLIDSDLEEAPEYLGKFYAELESHQYDVVFGVQAERKGKLFEKISGIIFWKVFNFFSKFKVPANHTTARLMVKDYVDALILHEEREVFISGLWELTGFKQHPIKVNKLNASKSSYTLRKKLSLFINAITSFSNLPLIVIFYFGLSISFFSIIYTINLLINWAFYFSPPDGWTSVMASIWLLGGIIISFIGIIGIYLSKIFIETKKRPYTIVKKIYNMPNNKSENL
jgi:putative glycosyltransferase